MKTLLIALLVSTIACCHVSAQAPADSTAWRYADVIYMLGEFTTKQKVEVDYGNRVKGWFRAPEMLVDENGQPIKFKTLIDALNWMGERGWELVQTYQTNESNGIATSLTYQHFILRRLDKITAR